MFEPSERLKQQRIAGELVIGTGLAIADPLAKEARAGGVLESNR